jgi:benzoylformate decarboxylase
MTTVHCAAYRLLRAHRMTTVFGNPGSNELPFLSALPDDFRYVLGLHEGVVVGMADGYAQVTGQPTLVNLHAAAGSGNAMGALTNAWYSHSPLVRTAGQQAREMIGVESMLANIDAPQLPRPLVKWSYESACAADVPRALAQAIHTAAQPAPGPVYLSVAHDDWAQPIDDAQVALLEQRQVDTASQASATQIDALLERVAGADNVLLVLGPQVDAAGANDDAVRLAEALGAPVHIAPSASRCPFPTGHACFRGVLPAAVDKICTTFDGHDLVLVIGAPVFRYHEFSPGRYLPDATGLVHLTEDAAEAARAPMGDALVGNIASLLHTLAERVAPRDKPVPAARVRPGPVTDTSDRLAPENVFDVLNEKAPEDAIYIKESTATVGAFWDRVEMRHPGSYYFPAAGGLGFGMPAAVGAQLAAPERRVIAVIGDGSANYGITALWSAAQYQVPVIFLILKNETYGALRWFAQLFDAKQAPGLDIPNIDFVSIANGYGVSAHRATTRAEFEHRFDAALATHDRPVLIEIPTLADAQ